MPIFYTQIGNESIELLNTAFLSFIDFIRKFKNKLKKKTH